MFFQGFVIEDSINYPETIRTVVKVGGVGRRRHGDWNLALGRTPLAQFAV